MKLSEREVTLLQEQRDSTRLISGSNGTKIFGGTTARTGLNYKALLIREDATAFTTLVCTSSSGASAKGSSDFIVDATYLKGDMLVAPDGYFFSAFTLSSGSVSAT